jgi:hypothetical protein
MVSSGGGLVNSARLPGWRRPFGLIEVANGIDENDLDQNTDQAFLIAFIAGEMTRDEDGTDAAP